MLRRILPLMGAIAIAPPALAQSEPFRVLNASPAMATELYVARSGSGAWGGNLLLHEPLPAGRQFGLRPPDGAGCFFDFRIVLQSGVEAERRKVDVCAERTVRMVATPSAPPPAAMLPQVGGGDQFLPSIPAATR